LSETEKGDKRENWERVGGAVRGCKGPAAKKFGGKGLGRSKYGAKRRDGTSLRKRRGGRKKGFLPYDSGMALEQF